MTCSYPLSYASDFFQRAQKNFILFRCSDRNPDVIAQARRIERANQDPARSEGALNLLSLASDDAAQEKIRAAGKRLQEFQFSERGRQPLASLDDAAHVR